MRRVAWRFLTVWIVGLSLASSLPAAEESSGKHFLWQVDSPMTRVYLLGSIHMLRQDVYPLAPVIEQAFAGSEILALEADIFTEPQADLQQQLMDAATYQQGETLKSELPKSDYLELMEILLELGIPMQSVQQYHPWFASIMAEQVLLSRLGMRPEYGVDAYFWRKAAGQKGIEELESVEAQLAMFSRLSDQQQILMLSWDVEDLERAAQDFEQLLQCWQRGDVHAMEGELQGEIQKDPRFKPIWDVLIDGRNLGMADRIAKFLGSKKRYFVVVGAAHLVGPKGLVALLRQRGYAVQQL